MVGVGMAFSFIPMSIAALAGRRAARGRARVGADQHVAADRRRARRRDRRDRRVHAHEDAARERPRSPLSAQTSGFALGFWVIAGIGAVSVVAAFVLVRGGELETVEAEAMQTA